MHIAFGTDEATPVTESIVTFVSRGGHRVGEGAEWPEVGRAVGEAVATGRAGGVIMSARAG